MTLRNKTTRRKLRSKQFTRRKRKLRSVKRILSFSITELIRHSLRKVNNQDDIFEEASRICDKTHFIYYKLRKNPSSHPHIHFNSSFAGFPGGGCEQINEYLTNRQAYNMIKTWIRSIRKISNADEQERQDWKSLFQHMLTYIKNDYF
jgi:hypothetical protein